MPEATTTRQQAIDELCAPGQPYELKATQIRGKSCRVFVNAPLTLRELYADNPSDLDFTVYDDERFSFEQVYRSSCALAAAMVDDYDIQKGDRVAIAMRNYPEWIVTFFAATSVGAIAVCINAHWSPAELANSLAECKPSLIVADRERLNCLADDAPANAGRRVIRVRAEENPSVSSADWDEVLSSSANAEMPAVTIDPDDDATIVFTSGSTGQPKGALSSHRNVIHALLSWELDWAIRVHNGIYHIPEIDHQEGMLLTIPLFHVAGFVAAMLPCLRAQRKIACMYRWDAQVGVELIEREHLTALTATAAITGDFIREANSSKSDISSLLMLGGGGMPRAPHQVREIDELTEAVIPTTGWGMTELSAIGASIAGSDYVDRPASSGHCSAVLDMRIVGDNGEVLSTGERGELQVRGTTLFSGYWNRPDATAEAFDGDWFRTGDAAYIDSEGFVFIVDRIKDLVIRGGENIGCGAVEAALVQHPDVLEASVYAVPDERLGEEVGATLQVSSKIDEAELRTFLSGKLASFEIPRYFSQQVETLPRIASGKFDKRKMQAAAIKT